MVPGLAWLLCEPGGCTVSSVAAYPAPTRRSAATAHEGINQLEGKSRSIPTGGQDSNQTINRVCAINIFAKGMIPGAKLQEQLSYRELLLPGEMLCYLLLKQVTRMRLIFPWLPHYRRPRYFGCSFCKEKLFTWDFKKLMRGFLWQIWCHLSKRGCYILCVSRGCKLLIVSIF